MLPPTDDSLNWLPEERVQSPNRVSDHEGLKRDLKSGDGIEVVAGEGFGQMVEGGLCRLVVRRRRIVLRRGLGRTADGGQRDSDGGLGLSKSPPDPIGSRLAHVAVELAKGLQFVVGADGTLEKPPELVRAEIQPFDLVGNPNAEGTTTPAGTVSIAAEDASGADRGVLDVSLLEATDETVPIEGPGHFAMGTGGDFQVPQKLIPLAL